MWDKIVEARRFANLQDEKKVTTKSKIRDLNYIKK